MGSLRTRLVIIFAAVAFLPMVPIAWLVYDLVEQSYQIGVNADVETALRQGVDFSRELYQQKREHLSDQLDRWLNAPATRSFLSGASGAPPAPPQPAGWSVLNLQLLDSELAVRWAAQSRDPLLNPPLAEQLSQSSGRLTLSQRESNRFLALHQVEIRGKRYYGALQAALPADFLEASDQALSILQQYRRLSLSPLSVPRQFLTVFLVLALGILALTTLLAVWLSRRITRSLDALVTGTREIGRGNLNYRIPEKARDEVGGVIRQFNQMTGDLKAFQERTRYLEQMAAWQEIARRLAHEIKNPLTPIQLTIQEMVDQYQGEDEGYRQLLSECHEIISEEIHNLRRLVREFSDFGRLPELELQSLSLNKLISEMLALYPHADLHLELAANLPFLDLDADRMRRVLINLIENALQAGGETCRIGIRTTAAPGEVLLEIRDSGPGMEEAVLQRIFEPYFTTKGSGTGLGLAITRKMVEEHGGRISVSSTPGKGTCFEIVLPDPRSEEREAKSE